MAYYVVFLLEQRKHVVVPAIWIKDIQKHVEKFLNNSLNRSQKFLCFYRPDDGRPDANAAPDFESEYCFIGQLKRYFGKYKFIRRNVVQ